MVAMFLESHAFSRSGVLNIVFNDVILLRICELYNLYVESLQISQTMLCYVSSRAPDSCSTPAAIRAKMLVIGELQGPLTVAFSRKLVSKHHIVSMSHTCLIGVIDLAGLFVPQQARPVGKWKTILPGAESFTNTNRCRSLSGSYC